MRTPNNKWDVERAAAWLRKHAWGEEGEVAAPALDDKVVAAAAAAATAAAAAAATAAHPGCAPDAGPAPDPASPLAEEDEIDIAGWPALVAPFYD